jgi:deoxycytidine triphosphate deaminase
MLLGIDEIQKLVTEKNLVEDLYEREQTHPEGSGYDLRVGSVYAISGKTYVGLETRSSVESTVVATYTPNVQTRFTIHPNEYFLIQTIEKLNLPDDILAVFYPRSTLYRSGVMLFSGQANPGYSGAPTFGIKNLGTCDFEFDLGARLAHVLFYRAQGGGRAYRGQWQGGRVTIGDQEETQI